MKRSWFYLECVISIIHLHVFVKSLASRVKKKKKKTSQSVQRVDRVWKINVSLMGLKRHELKMTIFIFEWTNSLKPQRYPLGSWANCHNKEEEIWEINWNWNCFVGLLWRSKFIVTVLLACCSRSFDSVFPSFLLFRLSVPPLGWVEMVGGSKACHAHMQSDASSTGVISFLFPLVLTCHLEILFMIVRSKSSHFKCFTEVECCNIPLIAFWGLSACCCAFTNTRWSQVCKRFHLRT